MSIEWGTEIEKGFETLADVFKMKYAYEYGKEAAPILTETYQKTVFPTLLLVAAVIIFFILRK